MVETKVKNGEKAAAKLIAVTALFLCLFLRGTPAVFAAGETTAGKMLVPMGCAVGINLSLDGVEIADVVDFHVQGAVISPAKDAGILPGDILCRIGGTEIRTAEDVKNAAEKLTGGEVTVQVRRQDRELQFTLTPFQNEKGGYELGVWIRDGVLGIGTLTFCDPETGAFGALGHPVSDSGTGRAMAVRSGSILSASIVGVVEGKPGKPGQLDGVFSGDKVIGSVFCNTPGGIFGTLEDAAELKKGKAVPVAAESEIRLGHATVLSNLAGTEVAEYDVEIVRIYGGEKQDERSFMLRVTDDDLLKAAGGIVQGMSGSPVLQNGKLIGAVTHVLINNPQKGYGISMEEMLKCRPRDAERRAA